MPTIALEIVPTSTEAGLEGAQAEARKVRGLLDKFGLTDRINTLLLPQIIPEEGDRPVPIREKLDPLEASQVLRQELSTDFILTQVTVFTPYEQLLTRLRSLKEAGVERVVYVGVPRVLNEGDVVGPFPSDALDLFRDLMPSQGVILIPTRPDEDQRFLQKLDHGANFALTQLLYTDQITGFLKSVRHSEHKPEILLSFGFVPKVELKMGLITWLIRDATDFAKQEMEAVAQVAGLPFEQKKAWLVDCYKRVIDGALGLGFPLGLHFECPYGVTEPALETFNAMLEAWSPD
jgi:hypothetical protein